MIDKTLVKKRFTKSLKTYNENALIQKKMAKHLIDLLPYKNFGTIFEIGSSTGLLTSEILKGLKFHKFVCNDIVEKSKEYIDNIIPENIFIPGDIETINLEEKYDLIISNAALQWCEDIESVIKKLKNHLNNNGLLAISIFGEDNFKEIKNILNIKSLNHPKIEGIKEYYKLYFDRPLDILKHIKNTGANAIKEFRFTKSKLKEFEENYIKMYSEGKQVYITYEPLYVIINN